MKAKCFKQRVAGTALTILVLAGAGLSSDAQDQVQSDLPPPPPDNSTVTGNLLPNIQPTSPLGQVVRLTQAGVDQSIILTYVTNSSGTFNLDSEKIIYLRDLGLPNEIITAMMQRDQALQQPMTATTSPPPAEPPPDTGPTPPEPVDQPPPTEVTTTYFYDTLAPYGSWIYVNGYGRCWRPSVCVYNPGWQPYCDHGHWVYTDCGWYWFSDYSWGWAPFHYGRWFQHPGVGWCWTPDTVWGPSWVTWRYSNGYCGWAPLPPFATYRAGVGFFYRGTSVNFGFNWGLDQRCFTFVPTEFFCDPHPRRHCVPPGQLTLVFNQTTSVNRFDGDGRHLANRGIDPEHISTFTHAPIRPVAIREITASPGHGIHGVHGEQLSHDGGTLLVTHPAQPGSSGQNHPRPPADNRPTYPGQPGRPVQVPVVTTHNPPNGNGGIRIVPQNPSTPVNHNPPPKPVPVEPSHANHAYSPPRWQQPHPPQPDWPNTSHPQAPATAPTPSRGQSGSSGTSHHDAPAAAPAPQQPSPGQSSGTPRSSNQNNQNQNQGNSGNGSGYNNPGSGSKH